MVEHLEIPGISLEAELGHGAHSVVYRGFHGRAPCVVKMPLAAGGWTRWVYREALTFARVRHPGLPRVLEVGELGDLPYLVTELVRGETLAERLALGPLPEDEVIDLGIHLANMLAAVHDAGLVHRDVKPRNIMLDLEGAMRLVDFGFAAPAERTLAANDGGTTSTYAAPEELCVPALVDARADLYALGRVLFESLACRLPRSTDDREVLAELRALKIGPAMTRIIRGLVAFDPDDRYADARALIADLHHASNGAPARGPRAYSRSPADRGIVRESELDRIRRAYDQAELGRGALVVVAGEHGSGKTHLIEATLSEVREAGGAIFDTKCQDGDAPLAALRGIFERGLASVRRDAPDGGASLGEMVRAAATADLRSFAAVVAPELVELVDSAPSIALAPGAFAEGAAEFVVRLARRLGPLAISIDDAQWLDAASADVLARVAHRVQEAPLLLLVGTRDTEGAGLVGRLPATELRQIDLAPLDDERIGLLLADYLGEVSIPRAITQRVTALADATPLGVLEVIGGLLDAGALRRKAGGWRLDAARAATVTLPAGTLALVGRRVGELAAITRRVLETAAILGATFDDGLLARVLEVDRRELDFALADARRAGLVHGEGAGAHRLVHDGLRELLLVELGPDVRRAIHQRVGDVLSERDDAGVETICAIARHYAAGDVDAEPARAVGASLAAARAVLASDDSEASVRHLETARSLAERTGLALDAGYHVAVGEAHLRLGDLGSSLEAFARALRLAEAALERARILGRIAWVHQTSADPERAWDALDRAFEAAGARLPRETAFSLVATVRKVAAAELNRLRPGSRPSIDPAQAEVLSELHYQNARLGLDCDTPLRFVQSTLEAIELAPAGPSAATRGSVLAEAHFGMLLTMVGRRDAGLGRIVRAEEASLRLGQPDVAAYCIRLRARVALASGDFHAALAHCVECEKRYGPWLELDEYCRNVFQAETLETLRGRPGEALAWIERAIGRVRRTPLAPADLVTALCFRAAAARAAVGRAFEEDVWLAAQLDNPIPRGDRGRFYRHVSWGPRARLLLERADLDALDTLVTEFESEGARPKRFADPSLYDYYVAVARGRVEACVRAAPGEGPRRLRALGLAEADLRAVAKLPLVRAHARLVSAELAWLEGSPRVARARLAEAEALAHAEGCSSVLFGAAHLRARLGRSDGKLDAARDSARVSELLACEHGAEARARLVRAEFGLPEPPNVSRSSTISRVSARSRRQLSALLTVVSARGADLRLEQQAALLLDELVGDFGAERAILLFKSEPSGVDLVIGRNRNGATFREAEGWQEALLHRVRDRGDIWPAGPHGEADASRVLAAPLFVADRAVGSLAFEREPGSAPFDAEDRELLLVLSHQVPVVLEATRLLAQREELQTSMSQAQKMEALGQLAGGVAHDFNNLLTALQASANVVRERTLGDIEVGSEIEVILQATRRATQLTRQLAAFSRHRPLPLTPQRANELLTRLEPRLKTLVGDRIQVELKLHAHLHTMRGDRVSFEQAVLNLASNARDAMPHGGKLVIETTNVLADDAAIRNGAPALGDYVCISVADDGTGMSSELVARAFEPFFSTRSAAGASGLGLTTVYAFAKNSGGWVALSSEIGVGTLVDIYLPRVDEMPSMRPVKRGGGRSGATLVLVVDDEEMLRKTVGKMLERAGYDVLVADGAARALELAQEHGDTIALAILDVLMPGVTGTELGRRFEEMRLPAKLLYMSGLAQESAIVSEAQVAAENVIQKPFGTLELLERVRHLLEEVVDDRS